MAGGHFGCPSFYAIGEIMKLKEKRRAGLNGLSIGIISLIFIESSAERDDSNRQMNSYG